MIDISEQLVLATQKADEWSRTRFAQVTDAIHERVGDGWVDWDPEVPEHWSRIIRQRDALALICLDLPLVIARFSLRAEIGALCQHEELVVVFVDDFDQECLTASQSAFQDAFGSQADEGIDLARLSVQDLWWATVS